MKLSGRHLLLGVLVCGALLFWFSRKNGIDFSAHQRFHVSLDWLAKLDATLNQNVLKARSRLVDDYDGLETPLVALRSTLAEFTALPPFVPPAGRATFERKRQEFAQTLVAKAGLIEDFKSANALLNNSLHYLPQGSRDLLASLMTDEAGRLLEAPLNRLLQQVLVHNLQAGADERPAIRTSLAELAAWDAGHPTHPQAQAVRQIASHVGSIILRKPRVAALTEEIIALPTGTAAEELLRIYDGEVAGVLQRAETVRWVLEGACVLLLVGVGYSLLALDSLNRNLESRVAARTTELSEEMRQRQRAEEDHRQAGQHLRMQEAELRVLFDFLPAMIVFKDTKNRILRANRQVAESVGKTVAEIEGRTTEEIYPAEAAKFFADDLEVIRSGQPKLGIIEIFHNRDGREFVLETDKVPVLDKDGEVIGLVALAQDVTVRRRIEEELRWKTAFLEAQVNSSIDGILVVNQEWKKMLQNRRTVELFKIPPHIMDDADDRKQAQWVAQAMEHPEEFSHRVGYFMAHPAEIGRDEIRLKDGTVLDRYTAPAMGADGTNYGRIWTFRDITERKRAEEALRESEERFAGIFAHAPIGVAMVSTSGQWLQVNRAVCQIVGYSAAELLATTFQSITHPDDLEDNLGHMHRLLSGTVSAYQMEKRYVHARGHLVSVLINVSLVRDGQGQPLYFITQMQDITERKQSEAELQSAHQQLIQTSRLAGMAEVATGVLHNVGNVLNSVNVSATLVGESLKQSKIVNLGRVVALLESRAADLGTFLTTDPQGRKLVGYLGQVHARLLSEQSTALSEVESLRHNIEHIKQIVSLQQQHAKFSGTSETLQIADLVEDTLRMNAPFLAQHQLTVVREFDPVPAVSVDRHTVLQILVNLVRNARQACDATTQPEKTLTIRVFNGSDSVKVAVADNGIGIAAENLNRVFNHGFTTKAEGHGFGLHSSALAAKGMGGALRAESQGPGHGATFTLELPVAHALTTPFGSAS